MKILHLCLASFYIDNNSYQENLIPRMHKRMGHEVKIIASTETYVDHKKLGYIQPSSYLNEDNIPVERIPYVKFLPSKFAHKLRLYKYVYKKINDFHPDFVFVHGCQFVSIISLKKYLAKHKEVKAVVDGHTDFHNSAKGLVSYKILHKIVYKICAQIIKPYVAAFFGTLPARADFFVDVYNIPREMVSLLPMGADDDIINKVDNDIVKKDIRDHYAISNNDFLIVTGGKINHNRPETLNLIEAVIKTDIPNVKLLFFGSVSDEYIDDFNRLTDSERFINVGWQPSEKTCEFLAAADLVVFPGLHSVMWEQAVALGKPCVFRKLDGFEHVDIGGNAVFIEDTSTSALMNLINELADKNCVMYQNMLKVASSSKKDCFLYSKIAEQSLDV